MRKHHVLMATLIAPFLMLVSPNSLEAADESKFFLQDHGDVRILRGLDPAKSFEPATLPEEIDIAPAAVPPEPAVEPRQTETQRRPIFTRQEALRRVRERGITVDRAGVRKQRLPEAGRHRREAIARARARGIPTNRATNLAWRPYSSRERDTRGIPTSRATNQGWTPYNSRDDRLSLSSSLNRTNSGWAPQRTRDDRLRTPSNDHLLWPPRNTRGVQSDSLGEPHANLNPESP